MNGFIGYSVLKILPVFVALGVTIYLAYIVTNPARLGAKLKNYGEGTPKQELYGKLYSKQILGAWICITLFFASGVAYDVYRSMYAPSIFVVYGNLVLTLALIFGGAALTGRALKK